MTERLAAEETLSDVLVSIDTRAALALRVVDVQAEYALETHLASELRDGVLVASTRSQVVSCGERVAGVHADPETLWLPHRSENPSERGEVDADRRALARGILQENPCTEPGGLTVDSIER